MAKTTVSRRADRTWKRLATWYGARFAEQYGATPPADWAEVIDRTDDERLETGLAVVRRAHVNHPPTLGQFEAAIPAKRTDTGGRASIPSQLSAHALRTFPMCKHQIARPWNYFGPIEEFISKHRGNEVIRHPRIRGVQIPACQDCEKPSYRATLDEVERREDAVA